MATRDLPFAPDDARVRSRASFTRAGSWADRLVAVGFVVGLLIPGIALAAGVRPPDIENRRMAEPPAVEVAALGDTRFYAAIDRFLSDWFPFRANAVRWLARLDYRLLGGTTNPDVTVGDGDWLFLTNEVRPRCDFDAEALLGKIDRAAAGLEEAGVEFRYVVAPDKHAIFPEKLRDDMPIGTPCSDRQRDVLRAGMQARPDYTVELWSALLAARAAGSPVPLYYEQDAHWTPHGALLGMEALVESLAPGTWNDEEVVIDGVHRHNSDLARLMGLPRREQAPRITMRPDVRVDKVVIDPGVHITNARDIAWYAVSTDRPTVPGRTLVVYDSFYANITGFLVPWFEESVWVHEGDLLNYPQIAAELPDFDNVVFERVERSAYFTDPERDLAPVIAREQARAGEAPEPEPAPSAAPPGAVEPSPPAPAEPAASPTGPAEPLATPPPEGFPEVTAGKGEWLFLSEAFAPQCDFGAGDLLGQLDRTAAAFDEVGVAFRYVVAPDKHAIYPEHLPDELPFGTPCTEPQRDTIREGLLDRPGHTVEVWTELEALRESQPDLPLYYVQDAHWTPHGAIVAIEELVESLAPGTWDPADVRVEGIRRHPSDLAQLLGEPRFEEIPALVVRPDVDAIRSVITPGEGVDNKREIAWYRVSTSRPVVPGRTLIVYDSFFNISTGYVVPWFEESVWVHHGDLFNYPAIADALPAFDNVVFQRTERSIYFTDVESDLRPVVEAQR